VTPGTKEAEAVSRVGVAPIKTPLKERENTEFREAASDQDSKVKVQSANVEAKAVSGQETRKVGSAVSAQGTPERLNDVEG
jgi:hypothetical protein